MSDESFKELLMLRLCAIEKKLDDVVLLRGRVALLWIVAGVIAAKVAVEWVIK